MSCVYWHFPSSSWATHGCTSRSFAPDVTTCSCSHLTSFALLLLPPVAPATWAPLVFYSGPPAVSLAPEVTTPLTTTDATASSTEDEWRLEWEQELVYSAAPNFGERIPVTERKERTVRTVRGEEAVVRRVTGEREMRGHILGERGVVWLSWGLPLACLAGQGSTG